MYKLRGREFPNWFAAKQWADNHGISEAEIFLKKPQTTRRAYRDRDYRMRARRILVQTWVYGAIALAVAFLA